MPTKTAAIKHSLFLFVFLLIIWSFYREYFHFSEEIEDLIVKPLLWLTPTLLLVKWENLDLKSIGISTENIFMSIFYAICFGAVFAIEGIAVNYFKYNGSLNFNANLGNRAFVDTLWLSLFTAIPEEIVFRGFIFNRVWKALNNDLLANLIVSLGWTLINVPLILLQYQGGEIWLYLGITFIYGLGASYIFTKTENVLAPILLHVLWEWPIILFR